MDYQKICSEIFKINPKVRFVAVFNKSAKVIAGGMREGVKSYLPESIIKLSADQAIIRWQTRLKLKDWIGLPKYAYAEYEKIRRYTIYLDTDVLLAISTEVELDTTMMMNRVFEILGTKI
jgi:hypothetical protein